VQCAFRCRFATRIAQPLEINWNRLSVAKKEKRTQQEKQRGHRYCAEWINVDAQREALIPEIMGLMEQVNDPSIALPQRFELASRAMAKLTGIFLSEALAPVADAERSVILSRLSTHLKAIIDTLARKKEIEASDTFNPSSPKLQTCFEWFLDVVHEAVTADDHDQQCFCPPNDSVR
jgi:hypothetical protein